MEVPSSHSQTRPSGSPRTAAGRIALRFPSASSILHRPGGSLSQLPGGWQTMVPATRTASWSMKGSARLRNLPEWHSGCEHAGKPGILSSADSGSPAHLHTNVLCFFIIFQDFSRSKKQSGREREPGPIDTIPPHTLFIHDHVVFTDGKPIARSLPGSSSLNRADPGFQPDLV